MGLPTICIPCCNIRGLPSITYNISIVSFNFTIQIVIIEFIQTYPIYRHIAAQSQHCIFIIRCINYHRILCVFYHTVIYCRNLHFPIIALVANNQIVCKERRGWPTKYTIIQLSLKQIHGLCFIISNNGQSFSLLSLLQSCSWDRSQDHFFAMRLSYSCNLWIRIPRNDKCRLRVFVQIL